MKRIFNLILFLFIVTFVGAQSHARPRIGLVLSGGGAKGLAHIGVLKVLEEAGIDVDYIGGTSMGSIIGGLYAIGYNAHQLDSIVRSLDWAYLLTDQVSRENLTMNEKEDLDKYIVAFPIRKNGISLPAGMVTGQNINSLFSRLTARAASESDFSKFPIPFLCVATDIIKGKPVEIKKGNLAEAMRASMALPSIFTPQKNNDNLLLDGGLVENFPVEQVQKAGTDIIIGVDVGGQLYTESDLQSITKIIEQTVFLSNIERTEKSRTLCNILIEPDITGYNTSSFYNADSLIMRGERAARAKLPEIQKLVLQLQKYPKPVRKTYQEVTKAKITRVEVDGLKTIPDDFIIGRLPFTAPTTIRLIDLDKYLNAIYATNFFDYISYSLAPDNNGYVLHLKAREKTTNYFRAGFHYDSDFKTLLNLNITLRNKIIKGSKIALDLALGENPLAGVSVYRNTGWNARNYYLFRSQFVPDYGLKFQGHQMEVYQYNNAHKVASYLFTNFFAETYLRANLGNSRAFDLGLYADYSKLSNRISQVNTGDIENSQTGLFLRFTKDAYNRGNYPTQGSKVLFETKYLKNTNKLISSNDGLLLAILKSDFVFPISRRVTFGQSISSGFSWGDSIPIQRRFYLGGSGNSRMQNSFAFTGLQFMQQTDLYHWIYGARIQTELWADNFLIIKADLGKTASTYKKLVEPAGLLLGYGATFGYRSPIGPLEISLMSSNKYTSMLWYINLGYWF